MKQSNTQINNYKNKIHIVKNKEIIIYVDGEESHRYHYSEIRELPLEDSDKVTEHIHQKYSNFEVENRHTKFDPQKMDDELESIDEIFQKNKKLRGKISNNNNEENEFLEEEDKTEPQLKEFFKDVEDGEWSMDQEQGIETTTEQKKLKKGTKITEEQKFPIQNNNNRKYTNNYYKEENVNMDLNEQSDDEESEESPQYIIEVESYTSPTFRKVDEKSAERAILNGIHCSQMINGVEKVGFVFLGENQKLTFVCFEDKKETQIDLNYIKRIYFNIRGSVNMRNYTIKSNNEKFIQFVQINNIKFDFKFKNEQDLEYLIKGLYVAYKNKTPVLNKDIIYKNISRHCVYTSSNKKNENNSEYKVHHHQHITNESRNINNKNYLISSKAKNLNYKDEEFEEEEEEEENKEVNENNEANNQEYNNNVNDGILTTTITEVFKNGNLINEETKQEYGGRITKLNSYSPDIREYQEYIRKSKLGKSEDNLNKYTETEKNQYNNNYIQYINH